MTLILDCVPYGWESDIWRLRYETLRDAVDGFVVVEARHTHSGTEKALGFSPPDESPVPVFHAVVTLPDLGVPGIPATRRREMAQRNGIAWFVDQLSVSDIYEGMDLERQPKRYTSDALLPPDAILLISDCDEIPRPEAVAALRARGLVDGEVAVFLQRLYYYNLNTASPHPWPGTRAARWADVRALSPHVIRNGLGQPDAHYPRFAYWQGDGWGAEPRAWAGWHLSYFGGPEQVRRKMQSFLHQELVTDENTDPAAIAARINAGEDVWGRPGNGHGMTLGSAEDVPPPVAADPARWAHFFHPNWAPTKARAM